MVIVFSPLLHLLTYMYIRLLGPVNWYVPLLYLQVDADNLKEEGVLDKVRKERGYTYEDVIEISRDTLPNYDEKVSSAAVTKLRLL